MSSSPANSNQFAGSPFDIQRLFRSPNLNPNPNPNSPIPFSPISPFQSPPPSAVVSYPPPSPQFHHRPFHPYPIAAPFLPNSNPNPNSIPNPNPNSGARIMALLGTASPSNLESAASMPPQSSTPRSTFASPQILPSAPPASLLDGSERPLGTLQSGKVPRGRRLPGGDRTVFDVDTKLPGESKPPQLEVKPITRYMSDPGLVLGRQIAVNRRYICYGLKQANIRVINVDTALRELLRGHTQRVSDMAFFSEDVPLLSSVSVEGKVFVWEINEGPDEENNPQITGEVITAVQIVGDEESCHPRVCWHPHKQEALIVGIGSYVLKLDTTKVGKFEESKVPMRCSIDKLIDGVQLIGKHDGEVTDLSISQCMTPRLVSASKDGTVKVWEDHKATPLVILRPHDGQPVNSVAFVASPQQPDNINLITAGPLNREVKIWASTSEEGSILLPGDFQTWQCTQTLELISSAEPQLEEAFFNQVVVLPRASLMLLANAKKNSIYAVHIDYAEDPVLTRMDYIADFTVTMPILSITGISDILSDGEHVVQVYCVQTLAIQQYSLELSRCLPTSNGNGEGNDPGISHAFEASSSQGCSVLDPSCAPTISDFSIGSPIPNNPIPIGSSESGSFAVCEFSTSNIDAIPSAPSLSSLKGVIPHLVPSSVPFGDDLPGRPAGLRILPSDLEQGGPLGDHVVDRQALDYSSADVNMTNVPSVDDKYRREESMGETNDISKMKDSNLMYAPRGNTTHLVTPSEILSGATSSSENSLTRDSIGEGKLQDANVNNDARIAMTEVVAVGASGPTPNEFDSQIESQVLINNMEGSFSALTSKPSIGTEKECSPFGTESYSMKTTSSVDNISVAKALDAPTNVGEEVQDNTNDMPERATIISQPSDSEVMKHNPEQFQGSDVSSSCPFNSTYSSRKRPCISPLQDGVSSQLLTMQETLDQFITKQMELQNEMSLMMASTITKEGKRVEAALGRSMEKTLKSNMDAMSARLHEENAKQEKLERDHMQHVTSLVSNYINKDFPASVERSIKKEISATGPILSRAVNPVIEKSISSAIVDAFQRGVADKAVNQLEKSVSSKLEATLGRQLQIQFQTSGKQALQDGLRCIMESSAIPAFEKSCKAMFEQVETAFQKGMAEHTSAALQQVESVHTPLALTLKDAINSTASITQNLGSELVDGQRRILALITAGNAKQLNPIAIQQSSSLLEKREEPLDPRKEITRLISECKFEEAFTLALQRSDVSIVSWLCTQVDLHGICSVAPLALSQGVLLSLLQQLACDVSSDTSRKVGWMRDVAVAINPTDPLITPHVRPIFEQVYSRLLQQRSTPTTTSSDAMGIQVAMHIINSLLMSCN